MAATSFIGKVAKRAKQLRKANPKIDWQSAIKKASIELKGTVRPKRKTVVKRVPGTGFSLNGVKRKRKKISGMPIIGKVRRAAAAPRKKTTVASTLQRAKKMILEKIGDETAKQFKARLKRDKKKIGKRITALKSQYRKL